jgi:hypothetical protein
MEPAQKLDREAKKMLLQAREIVEAAAQQDCNEAETRRRLERIFETLLGYDAFKHLTREHAVRGAGEAEYCDFAIVLDESPSRKPFMMVEVKRVNVDLALKHLNQISTYAINAGCEWLLLTNAKDWRLYHVTFGQPPETTLVESWHLLTDDLLVLWEKFGLLGLKNLRKRGLEQLWQKRNVLTPRNLLSVILSEEGLSLLRRSLKKSSGVALTPEEVVAALRRMLNESALVEMEGMKITFAPVKPRPAPQERKKVDSMIASTATDVQPAESSIETEPEPIEEQLIEPKEE